ncbi:MAG: hypothetical protein EPN37_19225 [Chitinophagaceae bacterium]|nr:MAG: hypothetical protein EPN37_19225 [Chitinophagaceae bacterium]
MPGRFWLAKEHEEVRRRYEAGDRVRDIAQQLGRSERSVRAVIERLSLRRPEGFVMTMTPRANSAWPRVQEALKQRPMSRQEIINATGLAKEHALRALNEHRGTGVHICRWQRSPRRPIAIFALGAGRDALKPAPITEAKRVRLANPFATAAGLVAAPKADKLRAVRNLIDDEVPA